MSELNQSFKDNLQQLAENVRYMLLQLIHYSNDFNNHLKILKSEEQLKNILNEAINTLIADASKLNEMLMQLQAEDYTNINNFIGDYEDGRLD